MINLFKNIKKKIEQVHQLYLIIYKNIESTLLETKNRNVANKKNYTEFFHFFKNIFPSQTPSSHLSFDLRIKQTKKS